MSKLKISETFGFPLDFVTQTQAILAKKGAGKTNTAVVQTEELLKAHQQVVVVDPTGAWWGLKSSADGKSAGYPVVIFGGEHADVPLEEAAGEIVATAIMEQKFSAILDLSLLRKGAMHRFMSVFLEALYRVNRVAMHLVVDEADTLAPQKPFGDEARTLGAMQDIVRRGRIRGIGCTLITQRPQVLNKDVLTQCEVLCTLRLSHPKDIGAIKEWIAVHGDEQTARDMMISLPSLPIGTAWFWSPGWGDFFERVAVRRRETFDSSATPKPGEVRRAPKVIAEIDIKKLGEQVQATIERQKENDPRELKARIRQLEQEVAKKAVQTESKDVYIADPKAIMDAVLKRDEQWQRAILEFRSTLEAELKGVAGTFLRAPEPFTTAPIKIGGPALAAPACKSRPAVFISQPINGNGHGSGEKLAKAERQILTVLAQYPEGRNKTQISILSGYSSTSGSFSNSLSSLRTKGFIAGENDQTMQITQEGMNALGSYQPLPTGQELLEVWYRHSALGKAERSILQSVVAAYPSVKSKEEIATETGYAVNSGSFSNSISKLRTLELIAGKSELKAADALFG